MASSVSKGSLEIIPDDFGPLYLPYISSLRQKQRAHSFDTGRYLQSLKIIPFDNNNSINEYGSENTEYRYSQFSKT